jgi:hypothetical protein
MLTNKPRGAARVNDLFFPIFLVGAFGETLAIML